MLRSNDFKYSIVFLFDYLLLIWMSYDGFRYTTDGGSRETLEKGTIQGDGVFAGSA